MQQNVIEILPGILEKDWEHIEAKIETVLPFATGIHIDLLDGVFAPNSSFADPRPFLKYKDRLKMEVHMMVDNPHSHIERWAAEGISRFIGQVEMMPDQKAFVTKAKEHGEVGLAVDAKTSISQVAVPFDELDFLFAMTVHAGFSNQSFLPENLEKVREWRSKTSLPIEVDGGINDITIPEAYRAGATRFVSTGFLFGKGEPADNYKKLIEVCQSSR